MLITILFCVIALLAGAMVGWLAGSAEKQRAVADARRRLEEATDARVAAETRLAALDEDKFVAMASRAFSPLGDSLVPLTTQQRTVRTCTTPTPITQHI